MVELAAGIFVGLFALFVGMFLFAMFAWVLGTILGAINDIFGWIMGVPKPR